MEALPLAHPRGGGLPASPRDPEMASCTEEGSWDMAPSQAHCIPSHAMEKLRPQLSMGNAAP